MALECPEHAATIQRVLAIPPKRQSSRLVDFLTRPEIEALLAVPDQTTWLGRRDRVLLLFAIRLVSAFRNSSGSAKATFSWSAAHTSAARAKGESSAVRRSLERPCRL